MWSIESYHVTTQVTRALYVKAYVFAKKDRFLEPTVVCVALRLNIVLARLGLYKAYIANSVPRALYYSTIWARRRTLKAAENV